MEMSETTPLFDTKLDLIYWYVYILNIYLNNHVKTNRQTETLVHNSTWKNGTFQKSVIMFYYTHSSSDRLL